MSNNSTALVATVKVVDDATTPLGKIQDSLRKAGATDEEINKQIANSQLMVEMAQKGRLSTSQQLKFAMDAEAAKGSELGTELVTLEREYAILVKQMQAMAKYGVEVPQSMISQANAAKKAADSIREQTEKTKEGIDPADRLFQKFTAGSIANKAFSLAADAAKEAISRWTEHIVAAAKPLEDLDENATASEKSLASIKATMSSDEFKNLPSYIKPIAVAFAAVNDELAKTDAYLATNARLLASRKLTESGINAEIDERIDKSKKEQAQGQSLLERLNKFRQDNHEKDKKRQAERLQIARENAEAELEVAAEYNRRTIKEEEDKEKELARIRDGQQKATMEWREYWDNAEEEREKEIAEKRKKASAAILDDQKKQLDAYKQTAETMGQAFGTGFAGMATGSKDAASTMVKSVVGAAATAIISHAVTAAAGAMAAESSIPIIGPILAVAAGAVMSGLVMALLSKLPSFHEGGVVGADDGMRLPGMKSNERLVNALVGERFVAPGASGGGGGGSSVVINSKSLFAPTSADTKRMVNQVGKALRRQRRLGYAT